VLRFAVLCCVVQTGGVHMEEDWPYTAMEDPQGCSLVAHNNERVVTIDGYQDVPVGDEAALLKAVAHQVGQLVFDGGLVDQSSRW
jgi:hypothetical protein